jgi:hypothetical protein
MKSNAPSSRRADFSKRCKGGRKSKADWQSRAESAKRRSKKRNKQVSAYGVPPCVNNEHLCPKTMKWTNQRQEIFLVRLCEKLSCAFVRKARIHGYYTFGHKELRMISRDSG